MASCRQARCRYFDRSWSRCTMPKSDTKLLWTMGEVPTRAVKEANVWRTKSIDFVTRDKRLRQTLQWRNNERDGVSHHRRLDCLLNGLFRRRSKKTSKLRVTGLCEPNSSVTGEFPAQRASNATNVSIWWSDQGVSSWIMNSWIGWKYKIVQREHLPSELLGQIWFINFAQLWMRH